MNRLTALRGLYDLLNTNNESLVHSSDWLKPILLPKGKMLVEIGDVSNKLYLMKKGVMRAYYLRGAEDITFWLVADEGIACLSESFLRRLPSSHAMETLESCWVYSVSYEQYRNLYRQNSQITELVIFLLEDFLITTANRVKIFRYLSVEERIAYYLSKPESLFRRIPDRHIATFLGTTEATFSRCLKKINRDDNVR